MLVSTSRVSADPEAGVLLQRVIDGIVLEHQDGIEQRTAGTSRQALHLVQRRPLMLAQAQVPVLQIAQPCPHLHLRRGTVHHRQRVDEQADDLFRAGKLRRTARDRRPEAHHRLTGMLPQQLRPGSLHQRVQRHPLTPRKRLQPIRQTSIQRQRQRPVARRSSASKSSASVRSAPPNASARKLGSDSALSVPRQNVSDAARSRP